MTFKRVVFPQPEGPIIIINSPRFTVRSKLLSAKDSASRKPYFLVRPSNLIIVSFSSGILRDIITGWF